MQDSGAATPTDQSDTAGEMMDETLTSVRTQLWTLAHSLTRIPEELLHLSERVRSALPGSEPIRLVVFIAVFLAAGIGAQMLFLWAARPWRVHFGTLTLATPRDRIAAVVERAAFATLVIAAFAAGSMGAYLLFAWPPLTGSIILGYLLAFLAIRLSLTATRFFLAPTAEHLRLVPVSKTNSLVLAPLHRASDRYSSDGWGQRDAPLFRHVGRRYSTCCCPFYSCSW